MRATTRLVLKKKREKQLRLLGPLLLFLFLLIFFYAMVIKSMPRAFQCMAIAFCYALFSWETSRLLTLKVQAFIPGIRQVRKRFRVIFLAGLPLSCIIAFFDHLVTIWIGFYKQIDIRDYSFIAGLHILCCSIVVAIYEGWYYLEQWKLLFVESEDLKKSNLKSQNKFLRDQIQPHFLFNSLNTLTALILTDAGKAVLFVEEMSTVYRYLLQKNQKELTTFKEERIFLNSYLLLLRTRFEDALCIEIRVDPAFDYYLLPPFVLQLLIENAVKHNIVSKDHPLHISIYTDNRCNLHIYNTLRPKLNPNVSEGTGLQNIISRYRLLKQDKGLKIATEDGLFKVILPLLKTSMYENFEY